MRSDPVSPVAGPYGALQRLAGEVSPALGYPFARHQVLFKLFQDAIHQVDVHILERSNGLGHLLDFKVGEMLHDLALYLLAEGHHHDTDFLHQWELFFVVLAFFCVNGFVVQASLSGSRYCGSF